VLPSSSTARTAPSGWVRTLLPSVCVARALDAFRCLLTYVLQATYLIGSSSALGADFLHEH
jgi:hypothetical protein